MNYVGIDPSLSSTAVTVYNKNGYFFFSFLKNWDKPTKWTKNIMDFVSVKGVQYRTSDNYSELENFKLEDYKKHVKNIVSDVSRVLVDGKLIFSIEGYSYNSETSSLIDLVSFSTLLRNSLLTNFDSEMNVYSPSFLKKSSSGLAYGWVAKGKKTIKYSTRNDQGIAGGDFKKREMMKALNDYPCDSRLSEFIKEYYDTLYPMANIPSPISDLVDSYWLLKVLMNEKLFHIKNILESED